MNRSPLRSPVLHLGLAVWLIGLSGWLVLWVADRPQAVAAAATLGVFLTAGKVVAITAGLSLGGHPWIVGAAVFVSDLGAVLFFYPFTKAGIRHLGRFSRRIREGVERARLRHERQEGFIARHGPWGLFLVSIIPVGFYSPLVISALGQVIGFRARQILIPVGLAMLVMTSAWVLTLNASLDHAASIDPRLPIFLTIGLFLTFLIKTVVSTLLKRRRLPPDELKPPALVTDEPA